MSLCPRPALALAACVLASACTMAGNSATPTAGGDAAPPRARASCVDAVARELKVPADSVTATSGSSTMNYGSYVVTLSVPGRPAMNCTVDENGVVSDVIRAR